MDIILEPEDAREKELKILNAASDAESAEALIHVLDSLGFHADRGQTTEEEYAKTSIRDAEIIFAGGRGMQNSDSFLALRQLADLYHASVGGSRPVVDSGWAKTDELVGQSGSFVRPKVYLAFGISGAVQHITAMKNSRHIIAVNVRKDAPIFRYCDYGIYGDADSIVRNMLRLLCR